MARGSPHPEELNEYAFPWGTILFAMVASALLGVGIWDSVLAGRFRTRFLGHGLLWFAVAVYLLHRRAREEARLWKQRLAREEDLVAAAAQTAGRDAR